MLKAEVAPVVLTLFCKLVEPLAETTPWDLYGACIGEWMLPNKDFTPVKERSKVMCRFIGVDLHKKMFTVCFYDAKSKNQRTKSYELKKIESFRKELRDDDIVGVEMTGNTRFFAKSFQARKVLRMFSNTRLTR